MLRAIIRKALPTPIKKSTLKFLEKFGLITLATAGPINFRGLNVSPSEVLVRSGGISCLIDIPTELLRNVGPGGGAPSFPCAVESSNPFVETVSQYINNKEIDYESSALRQYYKTFQPKTIAEALGLDESETLHPFLHQPPILTFPPWSHPPLGNYRTLLKRRQKFIARENRIHGENLDHRDGWAGYGPVNFKKGNLEIKRLTSITDSIMREGFRFTNNLDKITITIVRAGKEHRFLCIRGHHRTSTLAALGHTTIPVSPTPHIIDRDDVLSWPGVVTGVFTPDQALQVFDMAFHGRPPEAATHWWKEWRP